jgi:hypothetical protein
VSEMLAMICKNWVLFSYQANLQAVSFCVKESDIGSGSVRKDAYLNYHNDYDYSKNDN